MGEATLRPVVSGPVTGGRHGWPFGGPLLDLDGYGYQQDEFFLEGTASRYRLAPGSELSRDGKWQAEPVETAPYKTRILVIRPSDPSQFNGTVMVSWNNVSAGYDLFGGDSLELLENGWAFVGVTTQRVAIDGLPPTPMGLAAWDPERYGSLSHPGDDYSFDIFSQAGRAIGPDRAGDIDPMGGLAVRKVIAQGGSQSAGRLATYVNAVHPLAQVYDGYLLTIYFGTGSALEVGDFVVNLASLPASGERRGGGLRGTNLIRDDLDVPVMVVNSELEAIACHSVRQPDTDRFRTWEVAGTCHVSSQSMRARAPKFERDFGTEMVLNPGVNAVPMMPVFDAAMHHLRTWVDGGAPPPVQPRIDFAESGDAPEVVRDEHGIATGGIRLPQVEVPIAQNSAKPLADDIYSVLGGSSHPFSDDKLRSLYGDPASYVARFEEAARAAEKAGVLLPRDVEALVEEARTTEWR